MKPWPECRFIALDTETTGRYPIESELCEIAAVKWENGKVIDSYQTLIKPNQTMSDEVIAIHNITNEMVATAPKLKEVIGSFHEFISDSYLMAHHAPFDLGFLGYAFENFGLPMHERPVFCTSLLSRVLIPESTNHKLQTLVSLLNIDGGQAHRALDDSKACLEIGFECFRRVGESAGLDQILQKQNVELLWKNFSMSDLRRKIEFRAMVEAVESKQDVQIVYRGGSKAGEARTVQPIGLVRNPMGDYLVAFDDSDREREHPKRFYLNKILNSNM
jgi:DNA polymerase-3 subunit epsilon